MITLKTLGEASAQEVFDQVATHLLKQNTRSLSNKYNNACAYRGDNGLKCAAGCLIADDEYNKDMEVLDWSQLVATGVAPKSHTTLIGLLQCLHDNQPPACWRYSLEGLADQHNLNKTAIEQFDK